MAQIRQQLLTSKYNNEFTMTKFTITNIRVNDLLQDSGDDLIFFHVQAENENSVGETTIPFHYLRRFCKQHLPKIAKYFDDVRNNINGFGPKETKMWAIIQEEGFDIQPILEQFITHYGANKMFAQSNTRTEKEQEQLTEMVHNLGELMSNLKDPNLRDTAFMDMMMERLSADVLQYYPDIFDSKPEYITELNGILINNIIRLANDLDNLAFKAREDS